MRGRHHELEGGVAPSFFILPTSASSALHHSSWLITPQTLSLHTYHFTHLLHSLASMPTIVSASSSAAVRRARRRERRVRNRACGSVTFPHNSPPAINRRIVRRQNRDQASFDVDNCFNICQDSGFHQDPDIRIGSEASKGRRYAPTSYLMQANNNLQSTNLLC